MKKFTLIAWAAACILAAACAGGPKPLKTSVCQAADSAAYVTMSLDIELPDPGTGASGAIRRELVSLLDDQLGTISSYENERHFPPFSGDADDNGALLEYYRSHAFAVVDSLSSGDAAERASYIREDPDLTEEQKAEILADFPVWSFEYTLKKVAETERYAVFQSQNYIYMGGAHGGLTGAGCVTFDKKDGHRVAAFLEPSCVTEIQPLLLGGLASYFSEFGDPVSPEAVREQLFVEDGPIPLPAWTPYPAEEGLAFVYQQYEIASYAAGMPAFTLPYEDIAPWLTADARQLLGL